MAQDGKAWRNYAYLVTQHQAERSENTEDSHWGRNLVSCVAEQLQKSMSGSLHAEKYICQTLVLSNFEGKEVVEEANLVHLVA